MKPNLFEDGVAFQLAEGGPSARKDLSPKEVREATRELLRQIDEYLAYAKEWTYLEMKIHCDNFHDGKRSLPDLGEPYGTLNTYIERSGKKLYGKFQQRTPTRYGLDRQYITPKRKTGYSPAQLRDHAGEYEGELAVMTEEHYARLRLQYNKLTEIHDKLKKMEAYPK